MLCAKLVEIGSEVLEKKIFSNLSMYFRYLVIFSPWKRVWPFILINLNPLHLRVLFVKFRWNWPSNSGEEGFQILSMYLHYYLIISPLKNAWPLIWTNLNPHHLRMLCVKFGWNWLSGSGDEDFQVSSMYLRCFVIISLLKRA